MHTSRVLKKGQRHTETVMKKKEAAIVGTMMFMVTHTLRQRIARLSETMAGTFKQARESAKRANVAAENAMAAMGVKPPAEEGPVVDVGDTSAGPGVVASLARRTAKGLMLVTAASLLVCALWALGMFAAASVLAFMVLTRGLGLRIDLNRPAAA